MLPKPPTHNASNRKCVPAFWESGLPATCGNLFIVLAEVSIVPENFHRLKTWLLYSCQEPSSLRQWPSMGAPRSMAWAWSGVKRKCLAIFQILFLKTPMRTWSPTLCIWITRCTLAVKAGSHLKWKYGRPSRRMASFAPLHTSARNGPFGTWHFFCSLHATCVIPIHTSLPYILAHSLGNFTLKKNTKQRLLSFFYNSIFIT